MNLRNFLKLGHCKIRGLQPPESPSRSPAGAATYQDREVVQLEDFIWNPGIFQRIGPRDDGLGSRRREKRGSDPPGAMRRGNGGAPGGSGLTRRQGRLENSPWRVVRLLWLTERCSYWERGGERALGLGAAGDVKEGWRAASPLISFTGIVHCGTKYLGY